MLSPSKRKSVLSKAASIIADAEGEAAKRLTLASPDNVVQNRNPIWKLLSKIFKKAPQKGWGQLRVTEKTAYVALPKPSPTPVSIGFAPSGLPNEKPRKPQRIAKIQKAKAKPPKPSVVRNQGIL